MKTFQLKGVKRDALGKKATKAVRKQNAIPCVLYGCGDHVDFQVNASDVRNLVYTPEVFIVDLEIDGVKKMAIIKDMQFHPVREQILHIDFLEINDKKPVAFDIPVKLTGLAAGVRDGGKLVQVIRKLKVKGIYTYFPDVLNVDVTKLGLDKTLQVNSLSFDKLEIITSSFAIVAAVRSTRSSAVADTAAATTATAPAKESAK